MNFHTIFNHSLTPKQKQDAINSFGVTEFVQLPESLQTLWSNIPPDLNDISTYLEPLKKYLQKVIKLNDIVLVQGDFGATCQIATFVKSLGAKAVYATTKRDVVEIKKGDKIEKKSIFEHVKFREY